MSWMTRLVQISLVLLALGASGVGAADEKSKWEFEVEPYAWVTGNYGSVTVKGRRPLLNGPTLPMTWLVRVSAMKR